MSFFRKFRKNWADLKILDFVKEKTVGTQTVLEISYTDTKGKKSKIQRPLSINGGGSGLTLMMRLMPILKWRSL